MPIDYRNRRATIMGLGHFGGGVAAARWLAARGAVVTVSDLADERVLGDSLAMLRGVPIAALHLGGHCEDDFRNADLVVVNPAVRPGNPWLEFARRNGAELRTEIELFMENCPARIIGVTGSNGKSTTAAMIAEILRCQNGDGSISPPEQESNMRTGSRQHESAGPPSFRTFLGGNIGTSLLEELLRIGREDWVVLELSSFQLHHLSTAAKAPHVAVITGCTPNHLDWHASFAEYAAAKQRMLAGQTPSDFAVLNTHDHEVASWQPLVRGKQVDLPVSFEPFARPPRDESCRRSAASDRRERGADAFAPLLVPGRHNWVDACCAAAAARAAGCDDGAISLGLRRFVGLPMRLQLIAERNERRFYNDSAATTPESTIAALRSIASPVWLLAGGADKGCNFQPMAATIVRRARGAAFFGSVGRKLHDLAVSLDGDFPCCAVKTLDEALAWCAERCGPGESVLLSPGCAATDQFQNYRRRGERFAQLVGRGRG